MKEKVNQIKGPYTEAAMAGGVSQSLGCLLYTSDAADE